MEAETLSYDFNVSRSCIVTTNLISFSMLFFLVWIAYILSFQIDYEPYKKTIYGQSAISLYDFIPVLCISIVALFLYFHIILPLKGLNLGCRIDNQTIAIKTIYGNLKSYGFNDIALVEFKIMLFNTGYINYSKSCCVTFNDGHHAQFVQEYSFNSIDPIVWYFEKKVPTYKRRYAKSWGAFK